MRVDIPRSKRVQSGLVVGQAQSPASKTRGDEPGDREPHGNRLMRPPSVKKVNREEPLLPYVWMLAAFWTSAVAASFVWSIHRQNVETRESALSTARIAFEKDLVYRRWSAGHGGLYAPITEETPPNPYLAHVPERDITTPSGRKLTLINPVYMTRPVHELGGEQYGAKGHITSLDPLRPENGPDAWEAEALSAFERGTGEVSSVEELDGQPYMRLMRPLHTEESCLKCHGQQGYKLGDIRGGISVSVPLARLQALARSHLVALFLGHSGLWILGLVGLAVAARRVRQHIRHRHRAEDALHDRTHALGERVKELRCLYGISGIVEQRGADLDGIVQDIVDSIPSSWQYPEITCARILLEGRSFTTSRFRETAWKQTNDIVVNGEPTGTIEVFHTERRPEMDEGPFLKEERDLINAIAERLGSIIEHNGAEEDREMLREQLHQAQKMEAVGELAGGVAHDFGNLLTAISGYVTQAKGALPADHRAIRALDGVQEAAEQAGGVTKALLTFSCKTTAEKNPVELGSVVERSLRLLRRVLPSSIEVEWDAASESALWVEADDTQLQQVLMNLVINARDAMPDGGTLRISASRLPSEENGLATESGSSASNVRLVVSDNGVGMSAEVQDRIFEPFFTTKPKEQGTGLGLAIIHGIVKNHGGYIEVQSESGQGTTMTVVLPAIDEEAVRKTAKSSPAANSGQGEMVLLAEDNRQVRGIVTEALRDSGYRVLQTTDGASLMERYERHRDRIQLLVIDVDLPKESGLECLRRIRADGDRTPAIIITASSTANMEEQLPELTLLLRKPFRMSDLGLLVSRMLGARRAAEALT